MRGPAYVILIGGKPDYPVNVAWMGVTCTQGEPHEGIWDSNCRICPSLAVRDETRHMIELRIAMPSGGEKRTPVYYDEPRGTWQTTLANAREALKRRLKDQAKKDREQAARERVAGLS